MKTRWVACVAVLALAGCASATPTTLPATAVPSAPSASSAPLASSEPSLPPRDPTDRIKTTTWVVGTVTTGGSGPCFQLTTDDGTAYALYSADRRTLVKGVRMRVQTQPAKVRIACGPGKLVEMTAAETVG